MIQKFEMFSRNGMSSSRAAVVVVVVVVVVWFWCSEVLIVV